jgi:hypothetical protein
MILSYRRAAITVVLVGVGNGVSDLDGLGQPQLQ